MEQTKDVLLIKLAREFVAKNVPPGAFRPYVRYDEHEDMIQVLFEDCSCSEHTLTRGITVLEKHDVGPNEFEYIGFSVHGIQHCLKKKKIPLPKVLIWFSTKIMGVIARRYSKRLVKILTISSACWLEFTRK